MRIERVEIFVVNDREGYEMWPLGGFYPWERGSWLLETCRRLALPHGAPADPSSGRGEPR